MDEAPVSQPVNFNLDVSKVPVYFVDAYVISSGEHALTLNFAQAALDGSQQTIISRVAMTLPQAKDLLKNLNDHIEKFEI
jgi:hypothetical protein